MRADWKWTLVFSTTDLGQTHIALVLSQIHEAYMNKFGFEVTWFDSYDLKIVSHLYSRSNAAVWWCLCPCSEQQQTDPTSKGTSLFIRATLAWNEDLLLIF